MCVCMCVSVCACEYVTGSMCVCMRICVTGDEIALIFQCPLEVGLICVCVFERKEEGLE